MRRTRPIVWPDVHEDLAEILITRDQIARRVEALAATITHDYISLDDDEEILLIPIMTGSVIFIADLMRHVPHKVRLHAVNVSSYPGTSTTSQGVTLLSDLPDDLSNAHVLLVDDILDSGRTLDTLRREVLQKSPRSVRLCVLLRKQIASAEHVSVDYVGFDIPDRFVVGYGLDYDGYYRNLPDIGVLKPEAM